MRTLLATAFAVAALAGSLHAAQAGIIASADNPATSFFTQNQNSAWSLDGAGHTSLSFTTTKANEYVQLSLAGFCGTDQAAADGAGGARSSGYVQVFFMVDGKVLGELGNANLMCVWSTVPGNVGTITGSSVVTQQAMKIATPGLHTMSVLLQSAQPGNGSNLVPAFGQSHATVSN